MTGSDSMSSDDYVRKVVNNHRLPDTIDAYTESYIISPLKSLIREWGGNNLCDIKLSGSRAKGTAIDIATDLDLFISLSSNTPYTLKEIYNKLYDFITENGIKARKQNVSIGIEYKGKKVDLVPAKRQSQYGNDHSLYKRKADSWTKTNIDTHISKVRKSGRRDEIVALKVWREEHYLEFPSIYLECFTIDALSNHSLSAPGANVWYMLQFIADNITTKRVVDPANSNNLLSDDLTNTEKKALADQARESLSQKYWSNIIW